jgi:hypothetical protein
MSDFDTNEYCYSGEQIAARTIEIQKAKLETYDALVDQGLPIPRDLKDEIEGQGIRPRLEVR